MSEFELSTLAVLALLLLGVGGYSYWQIYRAQKRQEAQKVRQTEVLSEQEHKSRYPAYVEAQEPLPQTWPPMPSAETPADEPSDIHPELVSSIEVERTIITPMEPEIVTKVDDVAVQSEDNFKSVDIVHASVTTETVVSNESISPEVAPVVEHAVEQTSVVESVVQAEQPVEKAIESEPTEILVIQTETLASTADEVSAHSQSASDSVPVEELSSPTAHTMATINMEPPAIPERSKSNEIQFDLTDADERAQIEQRVTAQELKRRAAWDVFAPFARFEHWLHTAYPTGVEPIRAIDAEIEISINQPKTSADIERALYDLRLDTPLPLRLYGARAGQLNLQEGSQKVWQDLEPGAPYCAVKLTLQLANRSHCAQEEILQRWFALAETLRKRLSGQIEALPDVHTLADYARFLHSVARRVGQPIILQLHKENGLWPAYEVHQQLSACGAVLNERGIYIARNERNTPVYTVVNDVNNPRAQDFFRDQMAIMYVRTLSFCVELARVEQPANATMADEIEPIQRLLTDMKSVAGALDAQWQNTQGEAISVDELEKIAHEQTQIFVQQLNELGLPVGALMTKRLLLG